MLAFVLGCPLTVVEWRSQQQTLCPHSAGREGRQVSWAFLYMHLHLIERKGFARATLLSQEIVQNGLACDREEAEEEVAGFSMSCG